MREEIEARLYSERPKGGRKIELEKQGEKGQLKKDAMDLSGLGLGKIMIWPWILTYQLILLPR